jgi:hypothetical protein
MQHRNRREKTMTDDAAGGALPPRLTAPATRFTVSA